MNHTAPPPPKKKKKKKTKNIKIKETEKNWGEKIKKKGKPPPPPPPQKKNKIIKIYIFKILLTFLEVGKDVLQCPRCPFQLQEQLKHLERSDITSYRTNQIDRQHQLYLVVLRN